MDTLSRMSRLCLKGKLLRFRYQHSTAHHTMNVKDIHAKMTLYPKTGLGDYSYLVGKNINVEMHSLNAERLFTFIEIANSAIIQKEYIDNSILNRTATDPQKMTFDTWLVDDEHYDIDIQGFWTTIYKLAMTALETMIKYQMDGDSFYSYYNRRLGWLFNDLTQTLEALEKVWLKTYDG